MHRNAAAVAAAGRDLGVEVEAREYPEGTRTAADAARAIGVPQAAIVKSLVFRVGEGADDDEAVVALVGGADALDEERLARCAGATRATRADAAAVREATGFPVGGVPPFGHRRKLRVFVDEGLLANDVVWAAAGTPNACFPVSPTDLVRATGGRVARLARAGGGTP